MTTQQHQISQETLEFAQAWVDAIIRPDTEVLSLSRNAEIVVALLALVCAVAVHTGMILYSVYRKKQMEDQKYDKMWNRIIQCWGCLVHVYAVLFYALPMLTLMVFNPLLWIFMVYLLLGVMFHQWSLWSSTKTKLDSSYNVAPAMRRVNPF